MPIFISKSHSKSHISSISFKTYSYMHFESSLCLRGSWSTSLAERGHSGWGGEKGCWVVQAQGEGYGHRAIKLLLDWLRHTLMGRGEFAFGQPSVFADHHPWNLLHNPQAWAFGGFKMEPGSRVGRAPTPTEASRVLAGGPALEGSWWKWVPTDSIARKTVPHTLCILVSFCST